MNSLKILNKAFCTKFTGQNYEDDASGVWYTSHCFTPSSMYMCMCSLMANSFIGSIFFSYAYLIVTIHADYKTVKVHCIRCTYTCTCILCCVWCTMYIYVYIANLTIFWEVGGKIYVLPSAILPLFLRTTFWPTQRCTIV